MDTSVLVAGIAGFRDSYQPGRNLSADLLYKWAEQHSFVWLYSEEILEEYKAVLRRLRVRAHRIGAVINLIREGRKVWRSTPMNPSHPIPTTILFVSARNRVQQISLLR